MRSVGSGVMSPVNARASSTASLDWLSAVNYWREAAGLAPASDQPAWDLGIQHHLTYLEDTPASYRTGQYASAHTENPQSPYYTSDGATEGGDSDLDLGGVQTDLAAIDEWLTAPFHAIGMLRAQLTQVAFAEDSAGFAGLDVIQGLDYNNPAATSPILYPGPGSTTTLPAASDGESPSPLETCGWQGMRVGLPLVALLTQAPAAGLTASLSGPAALESTSNGSLCVVDQNTYHASDPVYGPTGLSILQGDKAVLLIPRTPLADGTYSVDIKQSGQPDITWAFSAEVPPPANLTVPEIGGWDEVGAQLTAYDGNGLTIRARSSISGCDATHRAPTAARSLLPPARRTSRPALTPAPRFASRSSPATPEGQARPPCRRRHRRSMTPVGPFLPHGRSAGHHWQSGRHTTRFDHRTNSRSCSLCVTGARPIAVLIPRGVVHHHAFTVTVAGRRAFTLKLEVSAPTGHHLFGVTRHQRAGRSSVRVSLPRAATGRGKKVTITIHVTIGNRHLTLRGTVGFQ